METSAVHTYISDISRYPLLTAAQERALAERIASGDRSAEQELVNANLRLVVKVARRYRTAEDQFMDLVQEGNLALLRAAAKYRASYNTRFSTYACLWIQQYIVRYLNDMTDAIHLPQEKKSFAVKVNRVRNLLSQELGCEPTYHEIAAYLGTTDDRVARAASWPVCTASLDAPGGSGTLTLGDAVVDGAATPEELVIRRAVKGELRRLIRILPEREQAVIYFRYNFCRSPAPHRLGEISAFLGVSSETVRQMELRALVRMRAFIERAGQQELFLTA
ncbi:MAG: RNA polymerase sigma factor RpoD/SigA [Treponema sp.]|nr:RNA polymerase sigma factor RpoD/SigA [Treponema sp.]